LRRSPASDSMLNRASAFRKCDFALRFAHAQSNV